MPGVEPLRVLCALRGKKTLCGKKNLRGKEHPEVAYAKNFGVFLIWMVAPIQLRTTVPVRQ